MGAEGSLSWSSGSLRTRISSILVEAQPFLPRPQITRTLMITYVPTEIQDPEVISKHFQ